MNTKKRISKTQGASGSVCEGWWQVCGIYGTYMHLYISTQNKKKTELPIAYPKAAWKSELYFIARSVSDKDTHATAVGYHVT